MNIKDLNPNEYKVVTPTSPPKLNIKDLPQGSYTIVQPKTAPAVQPTIPQKLSALKTANLPSAQFRATEQPANIKELFSGALIDAPAIIGTGIDVATSLAGKAFPNLKKYVADPIAQASTPYIEKGVSKLVEVGKPIAENKFIQEQGSKLISEKTQAELKGAGAIASLLPIGRATKLAAVESAPLIDKTIAGAGKIGGEMIDATKTKISETRKVKAEQAYDKAAGQVLQGDVREIEKGKKALNLVDAEGVETFSDLSNKYSQKIPQLASKIDESLRKDTKEYKGDELKTKYQVKDINGNKREIEYSYVPDAIDQLKKFYTSVNDVVKLDSINQLESKAVTRGLTLEEVNNLARTHGRDLNAYNASGQLASGLTKQAAENTRTGLKTTVREKFGDARLKTADEALSNLISAKGLADEMVEKVNKLKNRVDERGLIEKFGRVFGQAVDLITLKGASGFVKAFIPTNVGYKALNSIDLQDKLRKNLKIIDKINKDSATDKDIFDGLNELIKNYKGNQSTTIQNSLIKPSIKSKKSDIPTITAKKVSIPKNIPQTIKKGKGTTLPKQSLVKPINVYKTPVEKKSPFNNPAIELNRYAEDVRPLVDQIKEVFKGQNRRSDMFAGGKQNASSEKMGNAMEMSAILRHLRGEPTVIEVRNAKDYLSSAYKGKTATYNGQSGKVISTPSFGVVQFATENGVIKVRISDIKTKPNTVEATEYLKQKAKDRAQFLIKTYK